MKTKAGRARFPCTYCANLTADHLLNVDGYPVLEEEGDGVIEPYAPEKQSCRDREHLREPL